MSKEKGAENRLCRKGGRRDWLDRCEVVLVTWHNAAFYKVAAHPKGLIWAAIGHPIPKPLYVIKLEGVDVRP